MLTDTMTVEDVILTKTSRRQISELHAWIEGLADNYACDAFHDGENGETVREQQLTRIMGLPIVDFIAELSPAGQMAIQALDI